MTILGIVAVAGVVTALAIAPGLSYAFKAFTPRYPRRRAIYTFEISRALGRLERRGCVTITKSYPPKVHITPRGEALLAHFELKKLILPRPKQWDRKWRLVIFDVREERKVVREMLRNILNRLGFKRLQDSVWVFPFECEEVIELTRTAYQLRYEALYLTVTRFPQDRFLRRVFRV